VYRHELPRIYEMYDLTSRLATSDACFQDLDRSLAEKPQKLRQYRLLERDLSSLNLEAWSFLKSEVTPLLAVRDKRRGWEPLFNKLNQAKAYNHLKACGYNNIRFVPESSNETPDLEAYKSDTRVLCEVKTINVSDIEIKRRAKRSIFNVNTQLDIGFFDKLASDLGKAWSQMTTYDADPAVKKLAYVIVNFDDSLHEYSDCYREQIEKSLAINERSDLEIFLDWKPPFDTAKS